MSTTLADLPTDLHCLILSHDEEKIQLKRENEQLTTRVKMLQCLLDEARRDIDSDSDSDSDSDEEENEDGKDIYKRYLEESNRQQFRPAIVLSADMLVDSDSS